MTPGWEELLEVASAEVRSILLSLPLSVREAAASLPVLYERRPTRAMISDGLDPDLLGLFVGAAVAEGGEGSPLPPQILLFLENLWDFVEFDRDAYEQEVRTTYLHELGHYLGLDELDLEQRGLD